MRKKMILILLLSLLPCISMIRTGNAFPSIDAYLGGKNLEVSIDLPWSYMMMMTVNNSIEVMVQVENFLVLYVKNLQLTFNVNYGAQIVNFILVTNSSLELTSGWTGGFIRDFEFTPNTIGDLGISISADYEYTEGNQTLEEVGWISTYRIASIVPPENSYSNLESQNGDLQYEVNNLNASYQKLNTSYKGQGQWIPILLTATFAFIGTTIIALAFEERRFRRFKRETENKEWENKKW